MADGSHKKVKLMRKDDLVQTPNGPAKILTVLKFNKPLN
jgi:hypothetical protein